MEGPVSSGEVAIEKEREELRKRLKDEIWDLWRNHKVDKYNIGKNLYILQQLHAKPHTGTFLDDVDELGIPHNTAYTRIKFFKKIEDKWKAGIDPDLYPVRLIPYRNGKDDTRFPVEDAEEWSQEDLAAAADNKQAAIDEIVKTEAERIAKLKKEQTGRGPRMNISLILTKERRDRFKDKWNSLDEQTRSDRVYEAIVNVVLINARTN